MSLDKLCVLFAAFALAFVSASSVWAELPLTGEVKTIDGKAVDLASYKG